MYSTVPRAKKDHPGGGPVLKGAHWSLRRRDADAADGPPGAWNLQNIGHFHRSRTFENVRFHLNSYVTVYTNMNKDLTRRRQLLRQYSTANGPWANANFEKIDKTWLWMPNFGIVLYVENPGQKPTPVESHVDILGENISMHKKPLKHLFYKKRILNALLVRFSAFLSQHFLIFLLFFENSLERASPKLWARKCRNLKN